MESKPTYARIISEKTNLSEPLILDGDKQPAINGLLVKAPLTAGLIDLREYEVPLIVRAESFIAEKVKISHFAVDGWHQSANNFYVDELEISVPLDLYDDWKKHPDTYKHPDGLQFVPLDENGKPDDTGKIKNGYIGKITIVANENRETKERGCQGVGSFNGTLENIEIGANGIHIETDVEEHGISIVHAINCSIGSETEPCRIFSPSGRYKAGVVISDRKKDRVSEGVKLINIQAQFFDIKDEETCDLQNCGGFDTPAENIIKGDDMLSIDNNKTTPMEVADLYLGQTEYAGPKDNNPFIVACFQTTSYKATDDETPWCSAAHCYMHEKAGVAHTKSAASLSWKDWGVEAVNPKRGDTIIADYGNGKGHVGFYMGETSDEYIIKGGNQSDTYRVSRYSKDKAYRWYFRRQKTNLGSKTNWTAGTVGSVGVTTVAGSANELKEEFFPSDDVEVKTDSPTFNEESPVQCNTSLCPTEIPEGMKLVPTEIYQGALVIGLAMIAAAAFIVFERARRIATSGI